MLAVAVSALLILFESRNYSRSRRSSGSLDFVVQVHVRKKYRTSTTNSEMEVPRTFGTAY